MAMLKFQTKGTNLKALQNKLKSAKVLPLVLTSLNALEKDTNKVLKEIENLKAKKLIVRSSSKSEDSSKTSNAGAFLSLANIDARDKKALLKALREVGDSMPLKDDEILIQPMLEQISLCGVGFSVDKDNFAPYFCLQYDENGSSHSITGGSSKNAVSYFHYRDSLEFKDKKMQKVIELIKELEKLFSCNFLDIEFAFARFGSKEELFCLQVRPLVMSGKINLFNALPKKALEKFQRRFDSLELARPRILGNKALFGVMPDWNPAEIIGLRPKRLALSLYKEIITDNIWAYQRDNYGYRDLRSHPLIHSFLGIPYVDVRLSFNSFIPENLDEKIAIKLVNFYLQKLNLNHEFHDKIEFKIAYSCYDFNLSNKLRELLNFNFNENELKRIEFSLLELTKTIINPQKGLYLKDIQKAKILHKRYEEITHSKLSLIDKIYWLLEECKRYGTLPFAGVARAGFVAMAMLNSLVEIGFFEQEEKQAFLNSLQTISKTLSLSTESLTLENKKEFLQKFGHLRAGTYNILSPRYDEDFENYFELKKQKSSLKQEHSFKLSSKKKKALEILLKEHGLGVNANEFLSFLKLTIEGRELVKFDFTKLLSKAITYIEELGNRFGICKEDMAYLDIKSILDLYSSVYSKHPKKQFLEEIKYYKKEYELTLALKLPSLLNDSSQIFSFFTSKTLANFITQKSVTAKTARIEDKDLEGKIVLIASADPGYDYLFSKNIAGLITCYGGANSHMAIRASELALPAVIGVGESAFSEYLKANKLRIECESEQIFCL